MLVLHLKPLLTSTCPKCAAHIVVPAAFCWKAAHIRHATSMKAIPFSLWDMHHRLWQPLIVALWADLLPQVE